MEVTPYNRKQGIEIDRCAAEIVSFYGNKNSKKAILTKKKKKIGGTFIKFDGMGLDFSSLILWEFIHAQIK